ncbi:MAG TPA: hydrogenase maturation nickel metallochaperone HypA [Thauera aminoaromatica]|mgnify:FL=1|uniref:hydrogenase maturation nickel metallochaperone HypA n=1 Tax=Thauera aminoaromatica TaxID=164330 RepID=UPI00235268E1|nr:hydrogenase maturation nickel metallochaperone HypA [Thauera aminoaromatica]MCK6399905.1 hydrogenase maturation nickel metallochaperone HypA [Thauera aminoaromatica]HMV92627.1 hydrogenase maturation nickel metallochaperone HypA [Thauera aminoaromatica]HMY79002.1 hydrogenase maturation nickel metallochaperone HypA [Thauera aminoaromatica]HNB05289.1 hydrogenase maturation nickel metallochaperone HypA [Thauera aminoaromatica]HNC68261.1 hydrogenase maturation nickel metallochaperone HypA [Thaue
MHEMSLAEGVRTLFEDAAAADGFGHVRAVVLEIGELAAVEVEALRFCLDVVLADTIAAGAAIEVETLPGAGWCPACAQEVPIHQLYDPCPHCGGYRVQTTAGREMRVKALEVD